jgi:pimeloyl-ACP methyl ester carboxylesterase
MRERKGRMSLSAGMRRGMTFVLLVALAYALLCVALYVFQSALIYHPQPRRAPASTPSFMLEADGASVQVTTRPMPGADAVLYFGGNAEDVSGSLPVLANAFPVHALHLMHYRGWGTSGGKPSEAALVDDARRLFDRVQREHPRVTVVGRSLGSGVAVQLAASRPVARLVLVTPYDSVASLAAKQFPWVPVRWLLEDRFDSIGHASKIEAETTVVVAELDEVIARKHSDALVAALPRARTRVHVIAGAGHNTIDMTPGYVPLLAGADSPR